MKRRKFIQAIAAGAAVPVSALGEDQEIPYAVDPSHPEVRPVIQLIGNLGEPIKAMTVFRESVIIVTEYGKVYRMTDDLDFHQIGFTVEHRIHESDLADGPPTEWRKFYDDRRF